MNVSVTVKKQSGTPDNITLTVRRPDFDFSRMPKYWFDNNPWKTHFGTALMLVFPSGEHFVVQGVRNYRELITDAKLKQEVARFCGQEGFHSREHAKLNEFLFAQGFPMLRRFEKLQINTMALMGRVFPKTFQLALSASIEHLTSSFGHQALAEKDEFATMHPVARELLVWHAIEEMEHKSVAFDVHRAMGGWQVTRIVGLFMILPLVLGITYTIFLYLLAADGRLFDLKMWKKEFFDVQFANLRRVLKGGKPKGLFGAVPRDVAVFMRMSFHPWDIDDRYLIEDAKNYDPIAELKRLGYA